jgi:hypothetical protein
MKREVGRALPWVESLARWGALIGAPLFTSVEDAEQVQKDTDEDRHASEPEDDVSKHGWSPSSGWSDATALVAELEPRGYRMIPMVPAFHSGPPRGAKGEQQAGRGHEPLHVLPNEQGLVYAGPRLPIVQAAVGTRERSRVLSCAFDGALVVCNSSTECTFHSASPCPAAAPCPGASRIIREQAHHPRLLCGSGQQHPFRAPQRLQRIAFEIVSSGVSMSS